MNVGRVADQAVSGVESVAAIVRLGDAGARPIRE